MPRRSERQPRPGGRSVPSLVEPRFSQSLERGLAILECFTPERAVIGVHELVGELGMGPSTVHRYVATLVQLGYLEREANRRYRLTLKVTELGMSALNATGLREHARSTSGGAAQGHRLHGERRGDRRRRGRVCGSYGGTAATQARYRLLHLRCPSLAAALHGLREDAAGHPPRRRRTGNDL